MARQSTGGFPKHKEIPLYKKCTLFSTSVLAKSTSYLQFSLFWAEIWYITSLSDLQKKWCGNFSILRFSPFYRAPKMQKSQILAKNAHFWAFWPRKTAKNAKSKNSRITFFTTPTKMLYTKFQSNRIMCADLMLTFVENQKPKFDGFSAKFGKILTKNAHLRPKYSKYPNSDWIFGYKAVSYI